MSPPRRISSTNVIAGASAGVGAFLSNVSPTGNHVIDLAELIGVGVLICVVGARAPWWLIVGTAGLAGAIGLGWWPILLAAVAFAFGAWMAPLPDELPARIDLGSISLCVSIVAFAGSEWTAKPAASTWVATVMCSLVLVGGAILGPVWVRQLVLKVVVVVVAFVVVAGAALGIAGSRSRGDLRSGVDHTRRALDLVRDLDAGGAADSLGNAVDRFGSAGASLDSWWVQPVRLVPVLAQHRRVGSVLTGELQSQLGGAEADLRDLPLDDLRVTGGAVSIASLRALEAPLERFRNRLERLTAVVSDLDSPWLVSSVSERIDEFNDEVDELRPLLGDVDRALEALPDMLGEQSVRRYLLLFTTPSEARGLGGLIGNYSIVEVDAGRISVVESGRRSELERAAAGQVVLTRPESLLDVYGKFGLVGADGSVGPRSWSNLTMSPDWPSVATAAIDLFNASSSDPIDGVFVLDPYVLGQLTRYTGAVSVDESVSLRGRELTSYLLLDQYERLDRIEALGVLTADIVEAFLVAELPPPIELARGFRPLIREQRLLGWTVSESEQEVLRSAGLGEGLPELGVNDGFSLGITNAGASKIDAFLRRSIEIQRVVDAEGERIIATVTLANTAPAEGFDNYVIGNEIGLPTGTSQLYLAAYSSGLMERVIVDGQAVAIERNRDMAWHTAAHTLTLAPGAQSTIVYEFVSAAPDSVILRRDQPLAVR